MSIDIYTLTIVIYTIVVAVLAFLLVFMRRTLRQYITAKCMYLETVLNILEKLGLKDSPAYRYIEEMHKLNKLVLEGKLTLQKEAETLKEKTYTAT